MNTILYLGLTPPPELEKTKTIHCPLIKIIERPMTDKEISTAYQNFSHYTHLLFTSKTAVDIFFKYAQLFSLTLNDINSKIIIAVGKSTAIKIEDLGGKVDQIAEIEMAEGIIKILEEQNLMDSFFLWPHSSLSRPLLIDWMKAKKIQHHCPIFYDTVWQPPHPLPSKDSFQEIVFTSPSTVDAFFQFFGPPCPTKKLSFIGPITKHHYETRN